MKLFKGTKREKANPIKFPNSIEMLLCNPNLFVRSTILFCLDKFSIIDVLEMIVEFRETNLRILDDVAISRKYLGKRRVVDSNRKLIEPRTELFTLQLFALRSIV